MNPSSTVRDGIIHQAQQERMVRDTKLLQKINAAHREAFTRRFPGQVEHIMRLVAERLQAVLTNKPADLADPATWTANADEIANLAEALYNLTKINREYPVEHDNEHHQD